MLIRIEVQLDKNGLQSLNHAGALVTEMFESMKHKQIGHVLLTQLTQEQLDAAPASGQNGCLGKVIVESGCANDDGSRGPCEMRVAVIPDENMDPTFYTHVPHDETSLHEERAEFAMYSSGRAEVIKGPSDVDEFDQ